MISSPSSNNSNSQQARSSAKATKELHFNVYARAALKRGVDQLAEAVKIALGPRGRNVVIDKKFGAPTITKDGVTVAKVATSSQRRWRKSGRTA